MKASNPRTPFYYHELPDYIKNKNNTIQIRKTETNTIYQNVLIHGAKSYTIFREAMWKNKINLNFAKIWRNSNFSYLLHHSALLYKYAIIMQILLHYALKTNG